MSQSSLGRDLHMSQWCLASAKKIISRRIVCRTSEIMLLLYLTLEGHTWRTVLLSALHSNKDINHLEEIQRRKRRTSKELKNLLSCRNVGGSWERIVIEKSLSQRSGNAAKQENHFLVICAVAETRIGLNHCKGDLVWALVKGFLTFHLWRQWYTVIEGF